VVHPGIKGGGIGKDILVRELPALPKKSAKGQVSPEIGVGPVDCKKRQNAGQEEEQTSHPNPKLHPVHPVSCQYFFTHMATGNVDKLLGNIISKQSISQEILFQKK
jgi:hypothetical protein